MSYTTATHHTKHPSLLTHVRTASFLNDDMDVAADTGADDEADNTATEIFIDQLILLPLVPSSQSSRTVPLP